MPFLFGLPVTLWDARTGKLVATAFEVGSDEADSLGWPDSLAFSQDSARLVASTSLGHLVALDVPGLAPPACAA